MQINEIISLIFQRLTAFATLFAARHIQINRKPLNLSVIEKCISESRNLGVIDRNSFTNTLLLKEIFIMVNHTYSRVVV
jgi:hypothetical protein